MKLSSLRVGDIIRRGRYFDTFLGASDHPTDAELALAVWCRGDTRLYYQQCPWDEPVGNLISYRNDNLRELDSIFNV